MGRSLFKESGTVGDGTGRMSMPPPRFLGAGGLSASNMDRLPPDRREAR
ncbi:MAG: hypothetical protein WBM17_14435 [Anaerolineales bacterium]